MTDNLIRSPQELPVDRKKRIELIVIATIAMLPVYFTLPLHLVLILMMVAVLMAAICIWDIQIKHYWKTLITLGLLAFIVWSFKGGISRETGSAFLLAMLIMKTGELYTLRDARSMFGFALFCFFAAFLASPSPIVLLLGGVSALSCLAGIERLNAWGDNTFLDSWKTQLKRIGKIFLFLSPLGMMGFWFIPRLEAPLWGIPEGAVAKTGVGDEMTPGSVGGLIKDPKTAFRVTFGPKTPAPREPQYWRGPTLWTFDGRTWKRPATLEGFVTTEFSWAMPEKEGKVTFYEYQVSMEPTERHLRFYLDTPMGAGLRPNGRGEPEDAVMAVDFTVEQEKQIQSVQVYSGKSVSGAVSFPPLSPVLRRLALQLPEGFNPQTSQKITELKDKKATPEQINAYIEEWFKKEFTYTLRPPPLGRHTVDEFLFETKQGFCEHYASAYVTMMRMAGHPARVVTGYAGGEFNPLGGFWRIRQQDAHAWAEYWDDNKGWIRVDPTNWAGRVLDDRENPDEEVNWVIRAAHSNFMDTIRNQWNIWVVMFDYSQQERLLKKLGLDSGKRVIVAALLLMGAVVLGLIGMLFLAYYRKPKKTKTEKAWRKLEKMLAKRFFLRIEGADKTGAAWIKALDNSTVIPQVRPILVAIFLKYDDHLFNPHQRFSDHEMAKEIEEAIASIKNLRTE